ncbi:MAG: Ig-like domain-containing protein, partial [Acidobacteriota bacterium]
YFYVVTAVNDSGLESGFSNQLRVDVPGPANLPPQASNDSALTDEDTLAVLDVLANDSDPDGDPLVVAAVTQAAHGLVNLSSSGSLTYTPQPDYSGQDSFGYTIRDGRGGQDSAVVTITVRPVNDAPEAAPDSATTDEDRSVSIDVLANDSDAEGDPIELVSVGAASHGTATMTAQGVAYTPRADFYGSDSFAYTVQDSFGAGSQGQVAVRVLPVNDPPIADAGEDQSVRNKSQVILKGTASDPDQDELDVWWVQLSGPPVSLQNAGRLEASFEAPKLRRGEQLVFELSVSDRQETATDQVTVTRQGGNRLVFPVQPKGSPKETLFVGGVVFNPNPVEEALEWTALDSSGAETARSPGAVLQPGGQTAFLVGDLEEELGPSATLVAQGRQGEVQGFFMVGNSKLDSLDGIGEMELSELLYFPFAGHGGEEFTSITLFNPDLEQEAQIELQLLDAEGNLKQTAALTLAGSGYISAGLDELFGEATLRDGVVIVDSALPLQGFQLLQRPGSLALLPGLAAVPVSKLLAPHFFAGPDGDTEIRLFNAGGKAAMADIQAYDDSGNLLGRNVVWIQPGAVFRADVRSLCGLEGFQEASGYLELDLMSVSLGEAEVVGSVTFNGSGGRSQASLPLVREARSEHLFLHVAQSLKSGLFTGLAMLNPETVAAQVTVQAFDENGDPTAEARLELPAGTRLIDLLDGERLFGPSFDQERGHFRISSTVPLVAFAMFGDYQGEFLAAIEGQIPIPPSTE